LTTNLPDELATLQDMYDDWPWFSETVDLIAMIVSKTDFSICKNYDDQLVDKSGDLMKMGEEMRQKLVQTRQSILDVTKSTAVAGNHIALQRASSMIRHPYIDPVNVMQAELLKRYRALDNNMPLSPQDKELKLKLRDALVLSINAIAQGMKNSG
jgi:phosphoenolpyruvate carboxylase